MARKRYTAKEIIGQLRTIEIELGKGLVVVDACRKLGITEQTYYRWKKEYGGLRVDQAKRLKGLEQENARLKRLVADLSLDNSILNGYVESFNGKLRDELLNGELFYTLQEALVLVERWRRQYTTCRPHSALGYRPPAPETRMVTPIGLSA